MDEGDKGRIADTANPPASDIEDREAQQFREVENRLRHLPASGRIILPERDTGVYLFRPDVMRSTCSCCACFQYDAGKREVARFFGNIFNGCGGRPTYLVTTPPYLGG